MDNNEKTIEKSVVQCKPQKENVYNKFLPYSVDLDAEANELLADIKTNLIKSVLAREMRPGFALWTSRLNKYIKIYGMKISKDCHIGLIKLFYELLTIPNFEPSGIHKCATTLAQLLKKRTLLTRDDLQLQWRPLYDLCERVLEKSHSDIGMYRFFAAFENTIFNCICLAKIYFPAEATQEILDEFRPKLLPFNVCNPTVMTAIQYLQIFLPIAVKPEEADISYNLWFDEFMNFWQVCHNNNYWENQMMNLMANLARFQIGNVDWEPHVPLMFGRFLRALNLPVTFKSKQLGRVHKLDISPIALWIVMTLNGDNNSVFKQFEKFMQTLESYYHPANSGRWSARLRELLSKLSLHFVDRVYYERNHKATWDFACPKEFHLTDNDIDRFVNILKPCIESAIFSRAGPQETSLAVQYLAALRPQIIIPIVLDKLYASMDSLTEPHRLTSSMIATIACGRYMVQGAAVKYPEGPTHVIPLLMALLPGIDPNDIRKSFVTFNFIAKFVNMVPLANSSDASKHYDLSEEEHIVCEATAGLEDFVLQFFDRLCSWVESNSLDFVRFEQMTSNSTHTTSGGNISEMTMGEAALRSAVSVVLYQCSPEIFKSALKKVYNFVSSRVFEVQVSGKMIAITMHCFAKVNPEETLKLVAPYFCDTVEKLLNETPNVQKEEHVDAELLYNLLILSEIVEGKSTLLLYMDRIKSILNQTLHMNCIAAAGFASRMLELMMMTLTTTTPNELRSSAKDYGADVSEFLPVREWGKAQSIKELKINWYVPGAAELAEVKKLLQEYLVPELDKLEKYASGELKLTRLELKQTIRIVIAVLSSHPVLPIWKEKPIHLIDSVLDPWEFNLKVGEVDSLTMPDGANVRKAVIDTMHKVQKKILEVDEGDTQSTQLLIHIYYIVLFNRSRGKDFEFHWRTFHMTKKMFEDRLHKNKLHLRGNLIDRVSLQQEFRVESRNCAFTETHKQVLLDLYELSISRYSETRRSAQSKVFAIISNFPYSYLALATRITETLCLNSKDHHESIKGCLYVLLGPKNAPIVTRHDWEFIRKLWPLIVKSMPSEKASIINLITQINDAVHKYFPTIAIYLDIPDSCLDAARELAKSAPALNVDVLECCKQLELKGRDSLAEVSGRKRVAYDGTLKELLEACESGELQWRYYSLALSFFRDLVHLDVKYNPQIVRFFLNASINESITIRKQALKVVVFIMVQNKPKFPKTVINSIESKNDNKLSPGIREDNKWLLYDKDNLPKSAIQWNDMKFVHNPEIGYYCWPKQVNVYDEANRQIEEYNETQKEILNFFSNTHNVDKWIHYASMEEKKGQDHFNPHRYLIFKNLFKLFEDDLLPVLVPHLKDLVAVKNESSQRCAAEIISGIIRGAKHWSFEKVENLWTILIPIFQTAFANLFSETIVDWSCCISIALECRDPRANHWLMEFLLDDPLRDQTSFTASSRLHLLFNALSQQSWRNAQIAQRLLDYVQPHLAHSFQNIRERISLCLTLILSYDTMYVNELSGLCPSTEAFFDGIKPRLNELYLHSLRKVDVGGEGDDVEMARANLEAVNLADDEMENSVRLFKTVGKFITGSAGRQTMSELFFDLLPLATVLQSNDVDDELASISLAMLVVLAQTMTVRFIPSCIAAIRKVSKCPFWSARAVIAEFISVFVFFNMSILNTQAAWILEIEEIVMDLLEDTQPEVRTAAGKVLSGLLHCQFVSDPVKLLEQIKLKGKTKLKRKATSRVNVDIVRLRHGAVLGLCAFIRAHPYDVPDFLPDVFSHLIPHLSDPQPIPATIRTTLGDFKRTHHDNWDIHKLKFTEMELCVLSDLTVPPSYYA